MSVTTFITQKEHVAKLKVLRPPPPRAIGAPLLIPPRSKRFGLIGTAFDYLLRFEIERWAPHAKTKRWVAQSAAELFFDHRKQPDGSFRSLIPDAELAKLAAIVAGDSLDESSDISFGQETGVTERSRSPYTVERFAPSLCKSGEVHHESVKTSYKIGNRALAVVRAAKSAQQRYIKLPIVGREDQEEIARHAIRLAKIDTIFRAARLDESLFWEPESDDVQELAAMLAIVPFDAWAESTLILNPTFGEASRKIGGADCDLLAGDLLVDFKTTKEGLVAVQSLDQLLGYYLLTRNERTRNPSFPEIKRLGLYFARYGFLWERPVSQWVDHPQFEEIENWFVATALKT